MPKKKNKSSRAKTKDVVGIKEQAREEPHHVSWCFHKLDLGYPPSGGGQIEGDYAIKLFGFLKELEGEKPVNVRRGQIHRYTPDVFTYQKIEQMPEPYQGKVKQRLKTMRLDDLTGFLRLRFGYELRAYITPPDEKNISYVLWLDPKHEVWPPADKRQATGN